MRRCPELGRQSNRHRTARTCRERLHCIASDLHARADRVRRDWGFTEGNQSKAKEAAIMGDRLEERKDFTAEVTAKLPEAKKLAEVQLVPCYDASPLNYRGREKSKQWRRSGPYVYLCNPLEICLVPCFVSNTQQQTCASPKLCLLYTAQLPRESGDKPGILFPIVNRQCHQTFPSKLTLRIVVLLPSTQGNLIVKSPQHAGTPPSQRIVCSGCCTAFALGSA